ncbi:LOW QUALITY PROTEIN: gonadotropin releasing hormone receptor 2 [Xyrauchen texanus]|uniref:LOW QUALITY PROTEIN: gonadotropin releasing hormone receptor 2 n=1 Tax=Xyrauchen texanus TaxID=154827 RepID=UPI00224209F7|nr:LOW QUALITY PROTEIN: gonadotropin releasing hormone receptor 2 [Xyrauchen texanus]
MDSLKVDAVKNWPCPGSTKEHQLGFANFYRHFICDFSTIAAPLTSLLKPKTLQWTSLAIRAFQDPKNYDMGNHELLAMKDVLEEWRHWSDGSQHPFTILTDHRNLEYLRSAKRLNPRTAPNGLKHQRLKSTHHSEFVFQLNSTCNIRFDASNCNMSSAEDLPRLPRFTTAAQMRVTLTLILCALSTCCNLAVLYSVNHNHRKHRSHVRLIITNLAVADLLVTFIVMPLDAVWNMTVQWLAGDLACRTLMFLKLVAMYSCAFVTVVISLDRQAAILHPLSINKARRRNKVILSVAWTMSVVLSIPQVFLFHVVVIDSPELFIQCTTFGSFSSRWQETLYNMLTFTFLFLLPLFIMISCYTRILFEISKKITEDKLLSNQIQLRRSKNNIPKARMRTLKMSVVIVLSFMVCWTPYYMLGLWYWFCPASLEETVSHNLSHMLFIFGLLNACLDPIIYGLFTIPLCRGTRHRRHDNNIVTFELENTINSLMTSFRCSASSLTVKRLAVQHTSREKLELDGEQIHRIRDDGEEIKNGVAFSRHSSCME